MRELLPLDVLRKYSSQVGPRSSGATRLLRFGFRSGGPGCCLRSTTDDMGLGVVSSMPLRDVRGEYLLESASLSRLSRALPSSKWLPVELYDDDGVRCTGDVTDEDEPFSLGGIWMLVGVEELHWLLGAGDLPERDVEERPTGGGGSSLEYDRETRSLLRSLLRSILRSVLARESRAGSTRKPL